MLGTLSQTSTRTRAWSQASRRCTTGRPSSVYLGLPSSSAEAFTLFVTSSETISSAGSAIAGRRHSFSMTRV
jgi:hypothetical protein